MKNVFLIEFNERAVSGFTTFKNELSSCVIELGYKMNKIVLDAPVLDFCITIEGDTTVYEIPYTLSQQLDLLPYILRLYISDSSSTIFLHNFSPSYNIVSLFRKHFPKSKILYAIHDFIWLSKLNGCIEDFRLKIRNKDESDSIYNVYIDGIKTFNLVDRIICLSNDTLNLLKQEYFIDKSKLSYVPNGLKDSFSELSLTEKDSIRDELHIGKDELVFLVVGRISIQKGALDILDAFNLLNQRYTNFRLIFAGDVPTNFLNYIPHSIRDKIILLGVVETAMLHKIYSIADAGLIASYYEQCSYVGIEMKMFSLPVIASDAFGVRCMFDSSNAIVYHICTERRKTALNLYGAIVRFLDKPIAERDKISISSRKSYLEHYSSDTMSSNYSKLLKL